MHKKFIQLGNVFDCDWLIPVQFIPNKIVQKSVITVQKSVITLHKSVITVQKSVITVYKFVITVQKSVITAQKSVITVQIFVITVQKSVIPNCTRNHAITDTNQMENWEKDKRSKI